MIEVVLTEESADYRVYSNKQEFDDLYISFVFNDNVMNLRQFEDSDDDECQYIALTPQMSFALYGIMKAMFDGKVRHDDGRISKRS